jgi:hypothetical protein
VFRAVRRALAGFHRNGKVSCDLCTVDGGLAIKQVNEPGARKQSNLVDIESEMIYHKTRKAFESPIYRRSRLAARLILKARAGKKLKDRKNSGGASGR